MNVNLGCPKRCKRWHCVDLFPKHPEVEKADAIEWLRQHPHQVHSIKAMNLIEHLPNLGDFFEQSYNALISKGYLLVRTDNAEWLPFYIPLLHRLGWAAHCSDKYHPEIMNGTRHYAVFTKLHLRHYAELYNFKVLKLKRCTFGARLLGLLQKR